MAALFTVTFAIANPFASFGVFLPVLADTFGWSRGAISLAMSVNLLLGAFVGMAAGAIADRRGPRLPLFVTTVCAGAGFGLAATVQSLWQLYLFVGVLGGVGMSAFYVLSTATVARWFDARRGLALGLVLIGFNAGYLTGGPIAAFLIERVGWRLAWVVLGVGFCGVGALVSLLVTFPSRPAAGSDAGPAATASRWAGVGTLVRDWRLWALAGSWLLVGFVLLMLSVHAVPFARDQGVRLDVASLTLTAYGIGAVAGRLVGGLGADRFGTMAIMWSCCGLQIAALLPLVWRPSSTTLLLVFMLFGVGFAAADTAFARAVPEVFGLHAVGAVFGIVAGGWRIGAALGPAVAGFLYDATRSYAIPFGVAPVAVLGSLVLYVAVVRRRPRAG